MPTICIKNVISLYFSLTFHLLIGFKIMSSMAIEIRMPLNQTHPMTKYIEISLDPGSFAEQLTYKIA